MNSLMNPIKRNRYFTVASVKLNACPKRNRARTLEKDGRKEIINGWRR
jgi:hypothetical protein